MSALESVGCWCAAHAQSRPHLAFGHCESLLVVIISLVTRSPLLVMLGIVTGLTRRIFGGCRPGVDSFKYSLGCWRISTYCCELHFCLRDKVLMLFIFHRCILGHVHWRKSAALRNIRNANKASMERRPRLVTFQYMRRRRWTRGRLSKMLLLPSS